MSASIYKSKQPDDQGYVTYTPEENRTWKQLFERQWKLIQGRACDEYIDGIKQLNMSADKIPQIPDINEKLSALTGWRIAPVSALIGFDKFYSLLANRQFPCATFIRRQEDLDYLQEPDIFHEIFGHCPLLANPYYADFTQKYGELGLKANDKDRIMLARLYWFTIEFGLIETAKGLRIYGGGILSSKGETEYSLDSQIPTRVPLDVIDALRTPYRIDIFQTKYFVIKSFTELFDLLNVDLMACIDKARALGMHAPTYPPKSKPENNDNKDKFC